MDQHYLNYRLPQPQTQYPSLGTTIAGGIVLFYLLHKLLENLDYPVLAPTELVWNALVYILPQHLLLDRARRHELRVNGMLSQTHAAKSDALRRVLGIGGNAVLQKLPAEGFMRRASSFSARLQPTRTSSDAPAGLGNWDNSCYQNSVLQGLASLDSLKPYLRQTEGVECESNDSTTGSLLETISRLNDLQNNGRQLWAPAKLKSMSSWQQQDAQEYYSKIMDELDKEAARSAAASIVKPGLEAIIEASPDGPNEAQAISADGTQDEPSDELQSNPLDGLLAQRVTCTRCGYSEGISMIPFNCLTLPLGSYHAYDVTQCLDEYAKLEEIPEVECAKCTLLRAEQQLEQMLPPPPRIRCMDGEPPVDSKTLALPPELRAQAFRRLRAIQQSLDADDFADKTLNETCSIPKRARVSSTKTRQAVIGRAPRSLAIHINRSVFDELTGVQRKNYAGLSFPAVLDISPWIVKTEADSDGELGGEMDVTSDDSTVSDLVEGIPQQAVNYRIKAVITHYGRHENGHYICYRQHLARSRHNRDQETDDTDFEPEDDDPQIRESELTQADSSDPQCAELRWWRLSDEDVSPVSEQEVLAQHGVFMLFYEREDETFPPSVMKGLGPAMKASTAQASFTDPTEAVEEVAVGSSSAPALSDLQLPTPSLETEITPSSLSRTSSPPRPDVEDSTDVDPGSPDTHASTTATSDDELKNEDATQTMGRQPEHPVPPMKLDPASSPPFMRTARASQSSSPKPDRGRRRRFGEGPGGGFRAVAAS